MFWQEDEDKSLPYQIPDEVIDLSFAIQCKTLPVDHAWPLSQAILEHLPWLIDEGAGIHHIHVAESIIDGHEVTVGKSKKKPLTNDSVIFSRHVLSNIDETENAFLERSAHEIKQFTDFTVKKMLCGKTHSIKTPSEILFTRHLMIADLDSETSVKIQQIGLGNARELGCGLFLPHKGIKSLNSSE